jgi:hypothetical protein
MLEHTRPAVVVGPGRELGNLVRRSVSRCRRSCGILHGVGSVRRASADAEDEKAPAALPDLPAARPYARSDPDRGPRSLAPIQEVLLREIHPERAVQLAHAASGTLALSGGQPGHRIRQRLDGHVRGHRVDAAIRAKLASFSVDQYGANSGARPARTSSRESPISTLRVRSIPLSAAQRPHQGCCLRRGRRSPVPASRRLWGHARPRSAHRDRPSTRKYLSRGRW